jgi:hypothetical protein
MRRIIKALQWLNAETVCRWFDHDFALAQRVLDHHAEPAACMRCGEVDGLLVSALPIMEAWRDMTPDQRAETCARIRSAGITMEQAIEGMRGFAVSLPIGGLVNAPATRWRS